MKEIAVVATEKQYARFLMDNISKYLGRYASFKSYTNTETETQDRINKNNIK